MATNVKNTPLEVAFARIGEVTIKMRIVRFACIGVYEDMNKDESRNGPNRSDVFMACRAHFEGLCNYADIDFVDSYFFEYAYRFLLISLSTHRSPYTDHVVHASDALISQPVFLHNVQAVISGVLGPKHEDLASAVKDTRKIMQRCTRLGCVVVTFYTLSDQEIEKVEDWKEKIEKMVRQEALNYHSQIRAVDQKFVRDGKK